MSSHVCLLPVGTPRSAFGKLLGAEARYQWRVPLGPILGIGVPAVSMLMFGLIPSANTPDKSLGGQTVFSVYFPALPAFAVGFLALINLPTHLADYRQQGICRVQVMVEHPVHGCTPARRRVELARLLGRVRTQQVVELEPARQMLFGQMRADKLVQRALYTFSTGMPVRLAAARTEISGLGRRPSNLNTCAVSLLRC